MKRPHQCHNLQVNLLLLLCRSAYHNYAFSFNLLFILIHLEPHTHKMNEHLPTYYLWRTSCSASISMTIWLNVRVYRENSLRIETFARWIFWISKVFKQFFSFRPTSSSRIIFQTSCDDPISIRYHHFTMHENNDSIFHPPQCNLRRPYRSVAA